MFDFKTFDAADLLSHGKTAGFRFSAGYQGVNRERMGSISAYGRSDAELDFVGTLTKRDSGTISLGDGSELTEADDDLCAAASKSSALTPPYS